MTQPTFRRRSAAAAIGAAVLFFAGCGDGDDVAEDPPSSDPTEPSPTTVGATLPTTVAPDRTDDVTTEEPGSPTGTEIAIGVVYAETGRVAGNYGMSDEVAAAWAEWVNTEMGGVNGHPVEILVHDDQSTGDGAAAAGREAVDAGAVAVIINDSSAENALADFLAERGVPNIGGTANARPVDSGDAHWPNLYFPIAPGSPESTATAMVVAASEGFTNFGAIVCSEVPVCLDADNVYSAIAPELGIGYAGVVTVGAADPNYTAPCLALIEKSPDVISLNIAQATARAVMEDCATQGYSEVYGISYNSVLPAHFEDVDGLRLVGGLNGFPWWADAPAAQQFRDVMDSYGDGVDYRATSATIMWTSLELFRQTMAATGPASDEPVGPADVVAAYHAIDGETLGGLLPQPISYVPEGYQPAVRCFWPYRFEDGEFSSIELQGESGNGEMGDLRTACYSLPS